MSTQINESNGNNKQNLQSEQIEQTEQVAEQVEYRPIVFTVTGMSFAKGDKYRYKITTDTEGLENITVAQVQSSEDPRLIVKSTYKAYYVDTDNRTVHLLSPDEDGVIVNLDQSNDDGNNGSNGSSLPVAADQQQGVIPLDSNHVRRYLNIPGNISEAEVKIAIHKCVRLGLDPFADDIYLIPRDDKLTLTISVYSFIRKANKEPDYEGFEAGLVLLNENKEIIRRKGTIKLEDEKVVGAYAKVFRKGMQQPFVSEVSMDEYKGTKALWKSHTNTMIRKTAITHAMREAYPQKFSGLYEPAEFGDDLDEDPSEGYHVEDAEEVSF